jgi:hypothetical protein
MTHRLWRFRADDLFFVAILANKPSRISFSCRQHLAIYIKLIHLIVANLATRVPQKSIFYRQHEAEFIFISPIWRYFATISSTVDQGWEINR